MQTTHRFPHPAGWPFFYGYVVVVAGTLGIVMSAPGQTIGVSVFTDPLLEALALSRSQLSLAYLVGTLASGLIIARAGRLYDRCGGRVLATASAAALAVVLVYMAATPTIAARLGSLFAPQARLAVTFSVLALGFFLLRFSGQGMLTLASRTMVMEWFAARRGMANAVMGVSISFGFSAAPAAFDALIRRSGWQGAWRILALVLAAFALLAWLVFRRRPEDYDLVPDGPAARGAATGDSRHQGRDFSLREAQRTYTFWVFALVLVLAGALITAFTFHIVSIFDDAQLSRDRAVAVFIPAAFVSVGAGIVGSLVSDYIKLKYLAMVSTAGAALLCISLSVPTHAAAYWGVIAGLGLMQGMFGILSNVSWPRFFGRSNLGAISGFATALMVIGTALGPYLFSFARDVSGSYRAAALAGAAIAVVLTVTAGWAERPSAPALDEPHGRGIM